MPGMTKDSSPDRSKDPKRTPVDPDRPADPDPIAKLREVNAAIVQEALGDISELADSVGPEEGSIVVNWVRSQLKESEEQAPNKPTIPPNGSRPEKK